MDKEIKKEKSKKLTPKQERFCVLYASDREFFGNGVKSYIEAYKLGATQKDYNVAKARAYFLLQQSRILSRINELFEARGLNDAFVDKQLEKLITQDADLKTKVQAIKEYNVLRKRITKNDILPDINITITRGDEESTRKGTEASCQEKEQ